jgi:hypothetical protein
MSALPPKADIRQRIEHVCFVLCVDIKAISVLRPAEQPSRRFSTMSFLQSRFG